MNNMNKRETQLILNELGIIPNKRLGQNFLIDKTIVKKINYKNRIHGAAQTCVGLLRIRISVVVVLGGWSS